MDAREKEEAAIEAIRQAMRGVAYDAHRLLGDWSLAHSTSKHFLPMYEDSALRLRKDLAVLLDAIAALNMVRQEVQA